MSRKSPLLLMGATAQLHMEVFLLLPILQCEDMLFKDHRYLHHTYMHQGKGTCVHGWINASWIFASWTHASWIHASWIHASWIMGTCMMDGCFMDTCIIDPKPNISWIAVQSKENHHLDDSDHQTFSDSSEMPGRSLAVRTLLPRFQ